KVVNRGDLFHHVGGILSAQIQFLQPVYRVPGQYHLCRCHDLFRTARTVERRRAAHGSFGLRSQPRYRRSVVKDLRNARPEAFSGLGVQGPESNNRFRAVGDDVETSVARLQAGDTDYSGIVRLDLTAYNGL